jgi:hypothetical protein
MQEIKTGSPNRISKNVIKMQVIETIVGLTCKVLWDFLSQMPCNLDDK